MGETLQDDQINTLFTAAAKARKSAYAPYSKFLVGAAILDDKGQVHVGVNVENAAYPSGTCAEAGAVAAMIAAGATRIRAIAVVGTGQMTCTPCGQCRQRIREFSTPETLIISCSENVVRETHKVDDLLPCSFGPDHLPAT